MSWLYIIGVIIFAIVSNMNKAQKGKGKQKPAPGSMPTFGGGGADRKHKEQGSGFPAQGDYPPTVKRSLSSDGEQKYDDPSAFPDSEPYRYPTPNYETGEGVSQEQPRGEKVGDRAEEMYRNLDQMYSAFDEGEDNRPKRDSSSPARSRQAVSKNDSGIHPKQLQTGLIWAEILSPPYAKRPYGSRRRG